MKKALLFLLGLFLTTAAWAQPMPVSWTFTTNQVSENQVALLLTASIDDGWWLYSQHVGEGPIPTSFQFDEGDYTLVGETKEDGPKVKEGKEPLFDDAFVKKFGKKAVFTQLVEVDKPTTITGYLEFMTCDDASCLPPMTVDFSFDVAPSNSSSKEDADTPEPENASEEEQQGKSDNANEDEDLEKEEEADASASEKEEKKGAVSLDKPTSVSYWAKPSDPNLLAPVDWSMASHSLEGDTVAFVFEATIQDGWVIYAQEAGDGPVSTSIVFDEAEGVEVLGPAKEESDYLIEGLDPFFDSQVRKFKKKVRFIQPVVLTNPPAELKGFIEFMTCDSHQCLPPKTLDFSVSTADLNVAFAQAGTKPDVGGPSSFCDSMNLNIAGSGVGNASGDKEGTTGGQDKQGAWVIFLLGFGGGLLALLTPCVFPMIPLTVSFFTKGKKSRKKGIFDAALYGFFIFFIYVLLSAPFHLLDLAPDILNQISTNVWLNLAFFAIFVFFAFSFFGYYELTMPSGLANRVSSAESAGGFIGIFFMALTLAVVSFSCTGPIIGSLLAGTLSQGAWNLTAGMAGFGVALGLPFALFALFPGVMNSLPKSGGWLNSVKVVLGFIELALAIKFLSNADLVAHWGLVKREVFFGLWILIGILITLYILGFIKFPHDTPVTKRGPVRLGLAALFLGFTLYITPGFFGKNIALLSGFPPPMYYSFFYDVNNEITPEMRAEYGMSDECPYDLPCFKDYYKAKAYAEKVDKPMFLDFTGYACVNCRKMEENVWNKENILDILRNDVVLVSLYCDDKEKLPQAHDCEGANQSITTIGRKWSYFEYTNFGTIALPTYVMVDANAQVLMEPVGYTPDAAKYKGLIQDGLRKFEKSNL